MKRHIKEIDRICEVCHVHKVATSTPAGLLGPLPIPKQIWSDVSMDLVDGLPNSKGKTSSLVVVDCLSKYAHFSALSHPYSDTTIAQVYFDNVVKQHGLPETIVCDRDVIFTSEFWKQLFNLQGPFNFSST